MVANFEQYFCIPGGKVCRSSSGWKITAKDGKCTVLGDQVNPDHLHMTHRIMWDHAQQVKLIRIKQVQYCMHVHF